MGCVFCSIDDAEVVARNAHAFAIRDRFPVSPGHTLVIPFRHVEQYFQLSDEEMAACNALLKAEHAALLADDSGIAGFNVGINIGKAAGQTVFHCHVHLIPRRAGDAKNPRGGVRGVIPGKGDYQQKLF